MNSLSTLSLPLKPCLALIIAPKAARNEMLTLTARLALNGHVCVLDGGNIFDAYAVARAIRFLTPQVELALARVSIQRAFTCYQMLTLLGETPPTPKPMFILDMLATFHDESVTLAERFRLLRVSVQQLQRLSQTGPVVVSVRLPGKPPESLALVNMLQETCDLIMQPPQPESVPAPQYLPGFAPEG